MIVKAVMKRQSRGGCNGRNGRPVMSLQRVTAGNNGLA